MTARWVVDVAPKRDLDVQWRSISLEMKNDVSPSADNFAYVHKTHRMLRVFESVRKVEGNQPLGDLYTEFGRRIHHDKDIDFDIADALAAVGIDRGHADAADDELWDECLRSEMDAGISLCGEEVGTPIIAFDDDNGEKVGLFGPVISRIPEGDEALKLWDGFVAVTTTPGFWELKRTRTEGPKLPPRP